MLRIRVFDTLATWTGKGGWVSEDPFIVEYLELKTDEFYDPGSRDVLRDGGVEGAMWEALKPVLPDGSELVELAPPKPSKVQPGVDY